MTYGQFLLRCLKVVAPLVVAFVVVIVAVVALLAVLGVIEVHVSPRW
jgi:ABC-type multidrug transport system permease subunit